MVWASPPRESSMDRAVVGRRPVRLCGNVLHAPQRLSQVRDSFLRRRGGWCLPILPIHRRNSPSAIARHRSGERPAGIAVEAA